MKKLILPIIALTSIAISFANTQNLTNKRINSILDTNFQIQLAINNDTENVGQGAPSYEQATFFYLDFVINGVQYTNKNFFNLSSKGPYDDTFRTQNGTSETIFSMNLDPSLLSLKYINFNFNFGTLYPSPIDGIWFHAELTAATHDYDFHKIYNDTKNNGAKIVITASGYGGGNSANWDLQYYKF